MQTNRSLEIDIFRGLALIFIVVDHIAGGVLAWGTLRNFAIADAAEVFVFLAGVVTAIAYLGIANRRGTADADRRFWRRAWEIYRAFLITAALMFAAGGMLMWLGMETPAFYGSDVRAFVADPLRAVFEVLTLQRQPFFSDILPMYAFFALMAPLAIRLAIRSWTWLLVASLALWLVAPWLGAQLPSVTPRWQFNPFAWQVLFVLGLIVGLYPHLPQRPGSVARKAITAAAVVVVICGAIFSLFSYHESLRMIFLDNWFERGLQTFSKSNASAVRIVNFLAIAWLVYHAVRRGWFSALFARMRLVAVVGKNGLVCFVGGAVISILAETLSYRLSGGTPIWPYALLADCLAVAALIGLAVFWEGRRRPSEPQSTRAGGAHTAARKSAGMPVNPVVRGPVAAVARPVPVPRREPRG